MGAGATNLLPGERTESDAANADWGIAHLWAGREGGREGEGAEM